MPLQLGRFRIIGTIDNQCYFISDGQFKCTNVGSKLKGTNKWERSQRRKYLNIRRFGGAARLALNVTKIGCVLLDKYFDFELQEQLYAAFLSIGKQDPFARRTSKQVKYGITTEIGKKVLEGFEFNLDASTKDLFINPIPITIQKTKVILPTINPASMLHFPPEATHVGFRSVVLTFGFKKGRLTVAESKLVKIPKDATVTPPVLKPKRGTLVKGPQLVLLYVGFYKKEYRKWCPVNPDTFAALRVLEVILP